MVPSRYRGQRQFALSVIYRDAFAMLDAIGWSPDPDADTVDVPLTDGHIDQLRRCRFDLGHTNINRLDLLDAATTEEKAPRSKATSTPTAARPRPSTVSSPPTLELSPTEPSAPLHIVARCRAFVERGDRGLRLPITRAILML
jgi:hypothetical protein